MIFIMRIRTARIPPKVVNNMNTISSMIICFLALASLWYVDDYLGHPWDYIYKSTLIFLFIIIPSTWIVKDKFK